MRRSAVKLYFHYLSMLIKCRLEYKLPFFITVVQALAVPWLEILGILLLFAGFGSLTGWSLYEVLFICMVTLFGCSAGEVVFRGFDTFSRQIRQGTFDRLLVRPRSTALQVLGSAFELPRAGRAISFVVMMVLALGKLDVAWTGFKVFVVASMLLSSFFMFSGTYVLRAVLCFWTVEGLEVMNILTDGGRTALEYPLSIYARGFRFFFTFLVPFGCANFYPALYVLGKNGCNSMLYALSPWLGSLFLVPCLLLWRVGVGKYASTGS